MSHSRSLFPMVLISLSGSLAFSGCKDIPRFISDEVEILNRLVLPTETRCSGFGGTHFSFGSDKNGNGELEENEISSSFDDCNEPSFLTLTDTILSRNENPEETRCEGLGGTVLTFGHDIDGNGTLEMAEVQESVTNCRARVDGVESLIRITDEPGGANCTSGGIKIDSGLDRNQDRLLEDLEVTISAYVCDGLSRITEIETLAPSPAGCIQGGILVRTGDDTNLDGIPDQNVVVKTICNGERSLVRINTLPEGPACLQGGISVSSGFDRNNNLLLDTGETDTTEVVCHGIDGLTALSIQELIPASAVPSAACFPFGGSRLKTGLDLNRDGVLQVSEVQTTADICTVRVNSNLTLVRNTRIEPNTQASVVPQSALIPALLGCQYGGVITQVGADDNNDSVLQSNEVESEVVVCNQVILIAGSNSLITNLPATTGECSTGGVTIRTGVDLDRDNILDTNEVQSTRSVCNGYTARLNTTEFAPGSSLSSNCGGVGGVQIQSGLDTNGDNILQSGEVIQTRYVCDGFTALLDTQESNSWAECGGVGGVRVRSGYDVDGDSILDTSEIAYTRFVCDGFNGSDAAIRTTESNNWSACGGSGGVRVETGIDTDYNGVLDWDEVTQTSYVCDGLNGLNGFNGADAMVESNYGYYSSCGGYGTMLEFGTDYDGNGYLSSSEIADSYVFCD